MRLLSISLTLLLSTLISAAPTTIEKRACIKNGCECVRGTPQGQYCGVGGIYECNPTGACCFYGVSEKCKGFTYGGLGVGRGSV